MAHDKETRKRIFARTDGKCHLCGTKLSFINYGNPNGRGAWEIEHSNPRAEGGTDHLNNLYPAHIICNREKGTRTSRTVRAWHGRTRAPLSKERQEEARMSSAWTGAALGAFAGLVISKLLTPAEPRDGQQQGSRSNLMPVVLTVLTGAVIVAVIAYHLKKE